MSKGRISRRNFVKALTLAAGVGELKRQAPKLRRPNILFIGTDYQRGTDGPSLGAPFLHMPTFDQLCKEGVVFNRYYCTSPICMPARYSLITGQYPHTHGQQENAARWVPERSPILMELLKEQGYKTIGVGKMHFYPRERMAGFDLRITADNKEEVHLDDYERFLRKHGHSREDYLKLSREAAIPGVYDWPLDEFLHIDAFVGDQARKIVEGGELAAPWFMWVSFNGPHNPWDPPAWYSNGYKGMKLPLGNSFPGELKTKPKDQTRLRYGYGWEVITLLDRQPKRRTEIFHAIRAGHYGGLTFIDKYVEGILQALKEKGELDRTIIIYTSDHGAALGDHDMLHKGTFYDSQARVPLVVRFPALFKARKVNGFGTHVDILPTILSLVGAPVPPDVEGKDLTPLLTGGAEKVRDYTVLECRGNSSIITDRWKMGIYPDDGDGELYDLRGDPHELRNLYDKLEYAEVRAKLMADLKNFYDGPYLLADRWKEAKKKQDEFQAARQK